MATLDDAQRLLAVAGNYPHRRHAPAAPVIFIASPVVGLRRLWRAGMQQFVTAEMTDHAHLVRMMSDRKPAIVLLDLDLPQLGGIESVAALLKLQPDAKIVVLASRPDEKEGILALKMGAKGYCDRAITPGLLAKALDSVLSGEIWIGRKLTSHLLDELSALAGSERQANGAAGGDDGLHRLTPRERAILELLGIGASNKEISHKLAVTERTVKAHLTAVFRKLGTSSRVQAALLMLAHSRSAPPGSTTNVQLTK